MRKLLFIPLFFPIIGFTQLSPTQEAAVDSIKQVINTAKQDTVIINAWVAWDNIIYLADPNLDFELNLKIDSLCSINLKKKLSKKEKIWFLKSKGTALNIIGLTYNARSDYYKALDYYSQSLNIRELLGDKSGIATTLSNIGIIYRFQGEFDKAIDYFSRSLKIREEIGDQIGIAASLNNIGNIYFNQGDFHKAREYYSKNITIRKKIDLQSGQIENKRGLAESLSNIGAAYLNLGDFDKALENYNESLKIHEEIGNNTGIATSLNMIATFYNMQGDYKKAQDYYTKSLNIYEELGNKNGIASTLNMIGTFYKGQGDYKKAMSAAKRSLVISQEIGYTLMIESSSKLLWELNKKLDKPEESLAMYELYITTRDSMSSKENQKAVIQQEYKYAYEKQAVADSIKAVEEGKVKDALLIAEQAENKQHKQQQYYLYAGLALALLFGLVIFNRFKLANKQKAIIEEQKRIVDEAYEGLEEAHKEITDSINYAERIQFSFLATKELLDENLQEHFVFFQPKDVVSGDFYWAGKLDNGNFALVNADSTGHGVPGAIMSILNISSIESAVKDSITDPAAIFNDTRKTIIERLKKDGSAEGGKDGMDASLISFNEDKTKMSYVAANNPIWIIRAGDLIEIKPEKMPVGKHNKDQIPFKGGEYDIQKGDQIYTLTDGFQDQFGGPKSKKFMVKRMREYVLSISGLPMKEQHAKISEVFSSWKGDLEQVDDVCIVGILV